MGITVIHGGRTSFHALKAKFLDGLVAVVVGEATIFSTPEPEFVKTAFGSLAFYHV